MEIPSKWTDSEYFLHFCINLYFRSIMKSFIVIIIVIFIVVHSVLSHKIINETGTVAVDVENAKKVSIQLFVSLLLSDAVQILKRHFIKTSIFFDERGRSTPFQTSSHPKGHSNLLQNGHEDKEVRRERKEG